MRWSQYFGRVLMRTPKHPIRRWLPPVITPTVRSQSLRLVGKVLARRPRG